MTTLLLLAGLGLAFVAAALTGYLWLPRLFEALTVRGVVRRQVNAEEVPSTLFRMVFPIVDRLAPAFERIEARRYRANLTRQLRRAGMDQVFTANHFFAMKALTAIFVPLFAMQFIAAVATVPGFIAAAVGSAFIPDWLLGEMVTAREAALLRALPASVDVMSLSVEAGLEFLTAMQRLVEKGRVGPLRDELATILNDVRLGKTRQEALKAFADRVELPEVSSFVSVLVQADMLGASIGTVLQTQAERMRVERFQRAERAGARATQKILVPMVLFIFPAVLIVIVGPVLLQFIYGN
jgi:tight adherence protein C